MRPTHSSAWKGCSRKFGRTFCALGELRGAQRRVSREVGCTLNSLPCSTHYLVLPCSHEKDRTDLGRW
jgi:hypothetical protein